MYTISSDHGCPSQLSDSNTFCTSTSSVLPCNLALPWSSNVTFPAAATACPFSSPCLLSEVWGATSLTSNKSSAFPPGPIPVPLDVNTSVSPVKSYVLAAAACRYSSTATWENLNKLGWLAAGDLSKECISQASPTEAQWRALLLAGWVAGFKNSTPCSQCICTAVMSANPAVWWDALDAGPHRGGLRTADGAAQCTDQVRQRAAVICAM
jgi:hypothetical protein